MLFQQLLTEGRYSPCHALPVTGLTVKVLVPCQVSMANLQNTLKRACCIFFKEKGWPLL